jgi:hypothetical protein
MLQPYADLNEADIEAEQLAQRFAGIHLSTAIAGLTLCKAQAATRFGQEVLTELIGQLRDMEGDIKGWTSKTEEAEAFESSGQKRVQVAR